MEHDQTIKKKILKFRFRLHDHNSGYQRIRPGTDVDPDSFFCGPRRQSVYNQLVRGIREHSPLLVLTGSEGVGKSALIHRISNDLSEEFKFIFAYNYYSEFEEFVEPLCLHFGLNSANRTALQLSELLYECFDSAKEAGTRYIFVAENVQGIAPELLLDLIALAGIRKQNNACFQVLLTGLPSLEDKFHNPQLEQIKQKNMIWIRLTNFDTVDVENFIQLLLETGEPKNDNTFRKDAIKQITDYSKGNPRLISELCNLAQFIASLEGRKLITAENIVEAAHQCMLMGASAGKSNLVNRSKNAQSFALDAKINSRGQSSDPSYKLSNRVPDIGEYTTQSSAVLDRYHALSLPVPNSGENREEPNKEIPDKNHFLSAPSQFLTTDRKIVFAIIVFIIFSLSFGRRDPVQTSRPLVPKKLSTGVPVPELEPNRIETSSLRNTEVKFDSSSGIEPTFESKLGKENESRSGLQLAKALEKASVQMREKHLTTPPDNNALQTYQQILSAYPGQVDARYGLFKIKRTYLKWGLEAEMRGDLIHAKIFYSRALRAVPQDKVAITALKHIEMKLLFRETYNSD